VIIAVLVLPVVLIAAVLAGVATAVFGSTTSITCDLGPDSGRSTLASEYRPEQLANAAVVIAVGEQLGIPVRGQVIALATTMQEARLVNLGYGDRDSLGLFQQRPSQGWGDPAQVMNPAYAATQFYEHLLAVPQWELLPLTVAAQAVQRSGFPDAYARHEAAAWAVYASVRGAVDGGACSVTGPADVVGSGDCGAIEAPDAVTLAAINFACGQRGLPYLWGGDGADEGGFDCSGLTRAAYAAAGITLPRTADSQFRAGPRVPDDQPLLPGDLVFYGNPATKIDHVALYIGGGLMINAPQTGQTVGIAPYRYRGDDYAGATRPTPSAV
jgi:cell wall-associated NlpC family hydrolase